MARNRPFLARHEAIAAGIVHGGTRMTYSEPETTDEGAMVRMGAVDLGETTLTRTTGETTDDAPTLGRITHPQDALHQVHPARIKHGMVPYTSLTKTTGETTDDAPYLQQLPDGGSAAGARRPALAAWEQVAPGHTVGETLLTETGGSETTDDAPR